MCLKVCLYKKKSSRSVVLREPFVSRSAPIYIEIRYVHTWKMESVISCLDISIIHLSYIFGRTKDRRPNLVVVVVVFWPKKKKNPTNHEHTRLFHATQTKRRHSSDCSHKGHLTLQLGLYGSFSSNWEFLAFPPFFRVKGYARCSGPLSVSLRLLTNSLLICRFPKLRNRAQSPLLLKSC